MKDKQIQDILFFKSVQDTIIDLSAPLCEMDGSRRIQIFFKIAMLGLDSTLQCGKNHELTILVDDLHERLLKIIDEHPMFTKAEQMMDERSQENVMNMVKQLLEK